MNFENPTEDYNTQTYSESGYFRANGLCLPKWTSCL